MDYLTKDSCFAGTSCRLLWIKPAKKIQKQQKKKGATNSTKTTEHVQVTIKEIQKEKPTTVEVTMITIKQSRYRLQSRLVF